ncbi:hypothetical protein ACSSS7_004203 [Eimeria intestinalis]
MRLCLLALGGLTGTPTLSWVYHADAKAAFRGVGLPLTLMTEKIPQASVSKLAPSISSTSFVGVSGPTIPRLQPAQNLMRKAIAERLARAGTPATEQMARRMGPGPLRPSALQPPPTMGRPPSLTRGTAPPPPPPPPAPAAGATPAARLLFRRGAVRRPEAATRPTVVPAAAKAPPITPAASPGTILSKYVRTIAKREPPPKEAPKKELSEEELKAARETLAKQEEEFKQVIAKAVKTNLAFAEQRKAAAGAKGPEPPVERATMEALTLMTGGPQGSKAVKIRDIREVTTERLVAAECQGTQNKILGVGGMGVVIQVDIIDESCQKALGMDKLALKLMYLDLEGRTVDDRAAQIVYQRLQTLYEAEMKPLRLMGAAAKPGQSVKDMLKESHWAVPAYSAFAGEPGQVFVHNGFLFTPYLLLSELMLSDGLQLIQNRGVIPSSPIPMPAREYVCGQMIRSTARLHQIGLAHYDIKPDNLLVGPDGSVNLADFGMCGPVNVPKSCGDGITTLYADPAQAGCLQKGGMLSMNPRYDSWSVGMTCYLIMTARGFPYKIRNSPQLLQHISGLGARSIFRSPAAHGEPEQELRAAGASPLWAKIVANLLTIQREKRPSPKEILERYPIWEYGTD